ncbi:MAG: hypothetical protein FJY17_08395 [Bacteroidetes bacterium]|nr:hypothetical protein [Bacteroidota bacterium]
MKLTDKVGLKNQKCNSLKLYRQLSIKTVLDLGGGKNPQYEICKQLGVKQLVLDMFYPEQEEATVVRRKINILDFDAVQREILLFCGSEKVDCVVSIGSIEHLAKEDGIKLLEKVEDWSSKLIIFETPNGFVEQGPVDGNIHQIHLSGWHREDFERLGYRVSGTTGFKALKKSSHKGEYKIKIRGMRFLDVVLSRVLFLHLFPSLNFNLFAYKIKC